MSVFDTLTAIPCEFTAGEKVTWGETQDLYPQPDYTIVYNFAGQTPVDGFQKFTVTGSGSGAAWTFSFPTSPQPKPGYYRWQQIVTRASDSAKQEIQSGDVTVRPNLADTQTTSAAATMLANLNTAITTLTTTTNQSVSFNGQSYTKASIGQLYEQRVRLQAEVRREQAALAELGSDGARDGNIQVIFQ